MMSFMLKSTYMFMIFESKCKKKVMNGPANLFFLDNVIALLIYHFWILSQITEYRKFGEIMQRKLDFNFSHGRL